MRLIFGVLTILSLALTGCSSYEPRTVPAIKVYTTGYTDVRTGHQPQPRTTFSRNEMVVAIVRSADARPRSVLVEMLRSSDNNLVYKQLVSTHSGQFNICGPDKPLPAGNYAVRISEDGRLLDAANFAVF
jgi:hypothetical protein